MKKRRYRHLFYVFMCTVLMGCFTQQVQATSESESIPHGLAPYTAGFEYEDTGNNYIEQAICLDKVVYEYHPDTDTFSAELVDYVNCIIRPREHLNIHAYIQGRAVTRVGGNLLYNDCGRIVSVVLPKTIQNFFLEGEEGGGNIRTISFPEGAPNLKHLCVSNAWELRKVDFPKDAVVTGEFFNCPKLKNIMLPSGIRKVEGFVSCDSLTQMYLPEGVREICDYAFIGSESLNLYVPPSVTKIGKQAFGKVKKESKIKMLYCVKDSTAHRYAKKNKIPFTLVPRKYSKRKVENIIPAKKQLTLKKGEQYQLAYKIEPFYTIGKQLTFKSSNKNVVTVNKTGLVTARKAGEAVVTLKSKNGTKATITIRVKKIKSAN